MFDVVVAGAALGMGWPVLAGAAVLVRWKLGAPVLFRQRRPGRNARVFEIYKFRTMSSERDAAGDLLPDAERLGPVGRLLRSTSIDELPELWNVLRGEMSLVGPRPLLVEYCARYNAEQARRHEVRPGLTGWAQINGRNATSWERRLALDTWYVDNVTLALDCKILLKTVTSVWRRDGITHGQHATMPVFQGTPPVDRQGAG